MDDFFEFIMCWVVGILFFFMIFGLVNLVMDSGEQRDNKRQDKRYELCLKKDMQWVDGNCVASAK